MMKSNPISEAEEALAREARAAQKRVLLIRRMWKFYYNTTAADCAGLTGQGEKVQYTHDHKAYKRKGGKPPADYSAVEELIDFKLHMDRSEFDEAMAIYHPLKRLLHK